MRIPMAEELGNQTPQAGRGAASMQGVTAGTDAIGRLALIGADVAEKVASNERAMKVNTLATQAGMELENYVFELTKKDRDYSTQFERYTAFAEDLDKRYKQQFSGDQVGYNAFKADVGELVFKKGFTVRSNALTGQIDLQKGQLTLNMQTLSELAVQGDDEQREMVKTKANLFLADAYKNGVVDAKELATLQTKFTDDVVSAQVRRDILEDPDVAAQRLLMGEYSGMTGERQMMWLEKANQQSEARQRGAIAAMDRDRREMERAEKRAQESMAKAGDKLLFSGDMTPEWLESNRDNLDESDYRYFYKALHTGAEGFTDTGIYSDLRMRASDGEDIRDEARQFLRKGQLKPADYDKLVSRAERNAGGSSIPNWYKRGEKFIDRMLATSDLNPDPATMQRKAVAMDEWADWAANNPNPTIEEAERVYKSLTQQYMMLDTSNMTLLKPVPKMAVGGRANLDINATKTATVQAFKAGQMTEAEFEEQAALIKEWEQSINQMNQSAGGSNGKQP